MVAEARGLNLRDYLQVLARQRRLIAVVMLLVVGIAVALSLIQKPTYEATTNVVVQASKGGGSTTNASSAVTTQALFLTSPTVRKAVRAKLGHSASVSVAQPQIGIFAITAQARTAAQAAHDANIYSQVYLTVAQQQTVAALTVSEQGPQQKINALNFQLSALNAAVSSAPIASQSVVLSGQAVQRSRSRHS